MRRKHHITWRFPPGVEVPTPADLGLYTLLITNALPDTPVKLYAFGRHGRTVEGYVEFRTLVAFGGRADAAHPGMFEYDDVEPFIEAASTQTVVDVMKMENRYQNVDVHVASRQPQPSAGAILSAPCGVCGEVHHVSCTACGAGCIHARHKDGDYVYTTMPLNEVRRCSCCCAPFCGRCWLKPHTCRGGGCTPTIISFMFNKGVDLRTGEKVRALFSKTRALRRYQLGDELDNLGNFIGSQGDARRSAAVRLTKVGQYFLFAASATGDAGIVMSCYEQLFACPSLPRSLSQPNAEQPPTAAGYGAPVGKFDTTSIAVQTIVNKYRGAMSGIESDEIVAAIATLTGATVLSSPAIKLATVATSSLQFVADNFPQMLVASNSAQANALGYVHEMVLFYLNLFN